MKNYIKFFLSIVIYFMWSTPPPTKLPLPDLKGNHFGGI